MYLSAGGRDHCNQLGIPPTTKKEDGGGCVDAVTRVPFDLEGVQCVATGSDHSVIIKLGRVFAAGDDNKYYIGSNNRQVYEAFTEIKISEKVHNVFPELKINEEPISWAACGSDFTLYLTVSGKAIFCHKRWEFVVKLDKKAVSVFAGSCGGIIDEEGAIHIFDQYDLRKPIQRFSFESPAVDLACCRNFVCALTSDGRVFANGRLNEKKEDFAEVSSLKGKKIEKLSGYNDTCAALTSDGRVFICGWNKYGQLGNGTNIVGCATFTEVRMNEEIKDVSCSDHTLFLTKSNKILGCGANDFYQLFMKTEEEKVLSPIEITRIEADQVITGGSHSFILSGTGKLENPAKAYFGFHENNSSIENAGQMAKIDSLISICQTQSQMINQLMEICHNLEQQVEDNKQEIQQNHETNESKMDEMSQQIGELDTKLETVVKYINNLGTS